MECLVEVANTAANAPVYTSRIIKASALLPDTRTLFAYWNPDLSARENLALVRSQNLLGKPSRSRIEDILAIFRQRYLDDLDVANALAVLVQAGMSNSITDPIFYYYAAQSDRLLHDVVVELLVPLQWRGHEQVTKAEIRSGIRNWVAGGMTTTAWNEPTITRVAEGVMATLRDFGVLSGTHKKALAPIYLPIEAFVFISFDLAKRGFHGDRLLHSQEWQLFFLHPGVVERFFAEAHQQHLLQYHAAGSVIRVDFPADSLKEYARALAQTAH